eukprot:scaffold2498_cov195-Alexandrium_tamarense.AAC.16
MPTGYRLIFKELSIHSSYYDIVEDITTKSLLGYFRFARSQGGPPSAQRDRNHSLYVKYEPTTTQFQLVQYTVAYEITGKRQFSWSTLKPNHTSLTNTVHLISWPSFRDQSRQTSPSISPR